MSKNRQRKNAKVPKVHGYRPPQTHTGLSKSGKWNLLYALVAALIIIAAAAYWFTRDKTVTTASGLKYIDVVVGTGASPTPGSTVRLHYTGTLENGTKFDSSVDRGQPYEFVVGQVPFIQGWNEGLMSMKVGGKRKLIVPPNLGYGAQPNGAIPANSTLLFDLELLDVK